MAIKWECVKEITKALHDNFTGIQANSFGYSCGSEYDAHHKYTNPDDFVCAVIFKGGINNDYDYKTKSFILGDTVHYWWRCTELNIVDVLNVMNEVAKKYNCEVIATLKDGGEIDDTKSLDLREIHEDVHDN